MTSTIAAGSLDITGAARADEEADQTPSGPSDRAIWTFVAGGIGLACLAVLLPSGRGQSFLLDMLGLVAAAGGVYGIIRNRPPHLGAWRLFALGLVFFAAGDVIYDVATRAFGRADGYPFADISYLAAYPALAIALFRLARARFRRDTAIDSAVVAVALSAVIWQWVITPVVNTASGATMERIVTVAYPIMDIVLVVVVIHAVFTLPRWMTAAWLLFAGLTVTLFADAVYARLVAEGTYPNGSVLDALWPVSYFLLAGAVMHPSMRQLWEQGDASLVQHGRARIVVLGAALFAAPAVILLDGSGTSATVILAALTGAASAVVAWRIGRLATESNHAREVLGESEARFRGLVQHAADVIILVSVDGTVQYTSPAASGMFGRSADDVLGKRFADFLNPVDAEEARSLGAELVARPDHPVKAEFSLWNGESWRWIEATWTNQWAEPAVRGLVGNLRDITERKRTEALTEAETRVLELILSGSPVPETLSTLLLAIEEFVPDASGTIRLLDRDSGRLRSVAAPSLPGEYVHGVEELLGMDDVDRTAADSKLLVIRDLEAESSSDISKLCLAHGVRGVWSAPICNPETSEFLGILGLCLRTVREPAPAELALLERTRDLIALAIDRAEHTRQLGHLALHDTLTGLPNRALAQDRLEHAIARLADADSSVAVLFIDLDRFKLVNDGLGHETGDELLVAVSRRLNATVRHQDTIARFGGDEFVVLCEDLDDERHAVELAERAEQAFAEPFMLSHAEITLSASIGVAVTNRATDRASSLLRDADAAMYRAKRRGGARHELFDDAMHTQAVSRLLTERSLRQALDRDELRVLYQPQFDLTTGDRVCLEALLRWDHPRRGLIAPADFIHVAEETGIIVPIGNWVLQRACELARCSRTDGPSGTPLEISTNLSARQLQRPDFPSVVALALREYMIDPSTLCLEVSEVSLLDDLDTTSEALRALKDQGVRLAIDDFGTGGSSLTYLRRFPFDELKVDPTFIANLGASAADEAIVAATIDMAHALGMTVAAEGVETEEQKGRLQELGCDRAQGYLLAPPQEFTPRHRVLSEQRLPERQLILPA
jgi:diguanylate cyclase (GGDEF)-like protein/PAS domain S-box-containing protein